jgi:RNA polymerase sigma-70 factor, ECF subfamily
MIGTFMALPEDQILAVTFQNRVKYISYIRSIVCDYHLSEDVFQSVSMDAIRSAAKFQDLSHLVRWLWTACRNRALNELRDQNKTIKVFDNELLDLMQRHWEVEGTCEPREIISRLEKCISKLSSYGKELVYFRYRKNLTGQRLADALGRKCDSVYVALSRMHRMLAECVRQQDVISEK